MVKKMCAKFQISFGGIKTFRINLCSLHGRECAKFHTKIIIFLGIMEGRELWRIMDPRGVSKRSIFNRVNCE